MTKALFRVLGTFHGIAGLYTFALVAYLFLKIGAAGFGPGPRTVQTIGAIGGALIIVCLVAVMIATWLRPTKAPLFAWLAALAYVATPIVGGLFLFRSNPLSQIDPHFFYSAAVRVLAALALTLLSVRLAARANYSLKRTAADRLR